MKKLIYISLIITMMLGLRVSAEIAQTGDFYGEDFPENAEQEFFETGATISPADDIPSAESSFETHSYASTSGGVRTLKAMPMFKKYRIKITNYFKIKAHEEELEQTKKFMEEQTELEKEDFDWDDLTERSLKKVYKHEDGSEVKVSNFQKLKNRFKRSNKEVSAKEEETPAPEVNSAEKSAETRELTGGVKEVVAQKDIILDCDKLNYDDEISELTAIGHPVLSFPPQGVTIKADKLIYNTESNIIKAYDNVEIIKDGSSIYGDYVQINMNDETSIVTNMNTGKMRMLINAKNVVASEDTIELQDGNMLGNDHYILFLRARMVGPRLENMLIDEDDRSSISEGGLEIKVDAKEIYVTAKKDHDVVAIKSADIYYKDNYITHLPFFSAHTNKNHDYFEANYPELGSIPRVGMFIGPGYVFDVPTGGTVKVIPFLNYKDKLGVGGALKYRSGTNYTEMYYGSAADVFVLRGRQYLDDRLYFLYGMNSYQEDGFFGSGMTKYRAEGVYKDIHVIPDTLGRGLSARFGQRISAGYVQDSKYNRHNEHIRSSETGTTRFKYTAELNQTLYNYTDKKNLFRLRLGWLLQGSAALYGTGDTQFVGRTGPMLHTQYKCWMQDLIYFLSAYDGKTPVPRFDTYRYGRSNVYLRESLRLNKYITASWMGSVTLSDDAPNGKMFQENGFYISLGPDDLKFTLGYDFIRETTMFTFTTALDLKGTQVNYKKMVIKNPDRLAKDDSEKVEPVSFDSRPASKVKKTHAQVINIEDPDREQL